MLVPGTDGVQMGYRRGTDGVQMGYRWGTDGVQMGYRRGTDGVQMGYRLNDLSSNPSTNHMLVAMTPPS